MTTPTIPNVPLPPGAVHADDWQPYEPPYRIVTGPTRVIGSYGVWAAAAQFADGSIDDGSQVEHPTVHVTLTGGRDDLTTAEARQLARALIAAADQFDEALNAEGGDNTGVTR
ncbi:hypothetical protein ACAG26_06760 [Mycobacterium sp. pUA109]|uniref:hypothetical protein n=1 Tax=Mycobacterium sp. pUA109 TaxID=3238982 RepID=UPI00351B4904